MITEIDKSYMAGFLDADGTVTCLRGRATKWGNYIFTIALCFYNNDRAILEWFQERLGGNIYYKPRKRNQHEMASQLYMRNQKELQNTLELLLPYLRVKKQSANLALQYLKLRQPEKHLHSAHNPITSEQLNILKELRMENMKRSMQAKAITDVPIEIRILRCKKCGNEFRRYAKGLPKQCPRCWTPYWQ